jgi:septal ring factor EnvC (AmiA/AmiB activator)
MMIFESLMFFLIGILATFHNLLLASSGYANTMTVFLLVWIVNSLVVTLMLMFLPGHNKLYQRDYKIQQIRRKERQKSRKMSMKTNKKYSRVKTRANSRTTSKQTSSRLLSATSPVEKSSKKLKIIDGKIKKLVKKKRVPKSYKKVKLNIASKRNSVFAQR